MAIERARKQLVAKPWGVVDLGPWAEVDDQASPIGEVRYDRPDGSAASPALLLKLLFTDQPLSVQVHPDDDYARLVGRPNGKTESWYVLKADHRAKVALGLNCTMSPQQLRQSVDDGSLTRRIAWQAVAAGDCLFVPAGTIHAIGAGLVIVEIQQRSDTTFRLFDHGRQRELHVDDGVAAAMAGPAAAQALVQRLSNERTLLAACPHFVFERVILEADTAWAMAADRETWLLVIGGTARASSFDIETGDAIFAEADRVEIRTGEIGLVALIAYGGARAHPNLLQRVLEPATESAPRTEDARSTLSKLSGEPLQVHDHIGTTP